MANQDVVIIGAGNGGLTAAASLAQKGVQVLLLERHNIPGGCATSFCRGRFEFEVALHQLSGIGTPEKPGPLRFDLDKLGVMDKLEFLPMTDLYRAVIPGRIDLTLKPDKAATIAILQEHFPEEKEGIAAWFDLLYRLFTEVIGAFYFKDPDVTGEKYPLYFQYALKNTAEEMHRHLKDPILRTVASAYWTYAGLPPSRLPIIDMAATYFAYMEFIPFHIKGGSQALSNALAQTILDAGGRIRYNCGVRKIIVSDNRVRGVVTDTGEEIRTDYVISNASKVTTYIDLMDHDQVPEAVFDEMKQASVSLSAFTLYMGLDCVPEEVGITESTNFIIGGTDPDRVFERMKSREYGEKDSMLFTCYNLIDPECSPAGTCQAAAVTLKHGDAWLDVPPAEYAAEKYRIGEAMLKEVEKCFPGIGGHIEELEIATPLTHLRYLGHPKGAIYGFDPYVKDSSMFIGKRPRIRGLYGTGGWYGYSGFQPTLQSGVSVARAVFRKLSESA